jgi:hypothetical protein
VAVNADDPQLAWVRPVSPRTPHGCDECRRIGSSWVHLRLCLTSGRVACCDSSLMRHGRGHAQLSGHPIVSSLEPGESWRWRYVDENNV